MNKYEAYISRQKAKYNDKFSDSGLDSRFIEYYNSGQRIKVLAYGEELTGTVGATTGWIPCFLLMRTSRSIGSMYTLGPNDKIIAVKRGRTYINIEVK